MQEFENFFTTSECQEIISIVDNYVKELNIKNFISALPLFLPENKLNQALNKLKKEVSNITNLPFTNQESILATIYPINSEYKNHHDSFYIEENSIHTKDMFECNMSHGGQRIKTALLYLNDDFEGGETEFPKLNLFIKPKTGKLVIWDNVDNQNQVNHNMIHAAKKIIKGKKYVLVIYLREKDFI